LGSCREIAQLQTARAREKRGGVNRAVDRAARRPDPITI
jgi:hypothetical protein